MIASRMIPGGTMFTGTNNFLAGRFHGFQIFDRLQQKELTSALFGTEYIRARIMGMPWP
jgi:hypothetical protein